MSNNALKFLNKESGQDFLIVTLLVVVAVIFVNFMPNSKAAPYEFIQHLFKSFAGSL